MRISESAQTCSLGETEVERNFRLIGWNSMPYGSQDMGTDYLVEARDARRFSRGLIIEVQVKSGESYFTSAVLKPLNYAARSRRSSLRHEP